MPKKLKNYTHVKLDGVCLSNVSDPDKAKTLVEDLPIAEDEILIAEFPKDNVPTYTLISLSGGDSQGSSSKEEEKVGSTK